MFYFTLYFYQKHFLLHFSFSFYFFHGISQSEEKQDTGKIDIIINGDNVTREENTLAGIQHAKPNREILNYEKMSK